MQVSTEESGDKPHILSLGCALGSTDNSVSDICPEWLDVN